MVTFDAAQPGTPPHEWREFVENAPTLDLDGYTDVVVVAPHPDDETLGAGGLIGECGARGIPVRVVIVTDGSASHGAYDATERSELALRRATEVTLAVSRLNPAAELVLLWQRDGATEANRELIAADLAKYTEGADLVVGPWRHDGHRDHRVVGEICAALGVPLLEYPIWMWHWSTPSDSPRRRFATVRATHAKLDAIAQHASQLGSVLTDEFLENFRTGIETFITPPVSLGADYFDEVYGPHPDPWRFESRWYERRKRDITIASLPDERYERALEIGCSIGVLSEALSARVTHLRAIDLAESAIASARERSLDGVDFEVMDVASTFPDGEFDLIVLSEVGYYRSPDDLDALLADVTAHLAPGGTLLACHWRHLVGDYPMTGDEVHASITLPRLVHHVEEDFVLDVYSHDERSVARREGIV
jgi:LmbE family N-acetylglucosaminyl deacetylase